MTAANQKEIYSNNYYKVFHRVKKDQPTLMLNHNATIGRTFYYAL